MRARVPVWMRFAHLADRAAAAGAVGAISAEVVLLFTPAAEAVAIVSTACLCVLSAGFVASAEHDQTHCLVCIASFPLDDAADVAHRQRGSLYGAHLVGSVIGWVVRHVVSLWWRARRRPGPADPKWPVATAVLLLWSAVVAASAIVPDRWQMLVLLVPPVAAVVVLRRHHRLARWCPWCRDDGGDDDGEETGDPDPAPGKQIHA